MGTQGGAPPQARVSQRKSPPFWSGHGGERKKGGGREGKERPLCHIGKGNGIGLGRGKGAASRWSGGPRQAAAADPLARACSGCRWGGLGRARRPGGGGTVCLARSTPHTGSSGAQGLWSEFTAKPQLAAPKGSTGPPGLSEASGPVSRRARRLLGLTWAVPVGAGSESWRAADLQRQAQPTSNSASAPTTATT